MRRARSVMIAATRSPYTSATPVPGGACTANTPPSGCATASLTANCSLRTRRAVRRPAPGRDAVGSASVPHHQRLPAHVHAADPESVTVDAGMTRRRAILGLEADLERASVRRDTPTELRSAAPPMSAESPDPPISPGPPRCSGTDWERRRRYPVLPSWSVAPCLFLTPRCFPKPCSVVPRDTLSVHPFTAPDDRSPADSRPRS